MTQPDHNPWLQHLALREMSCGALICAFEGRAAVIGVFPRICWNKDWLVTAGEQGRSAFEEKAGPAAASSLALRNIIDQLVQRTSTKGGGLF